MDHFLSAEFCRGGCSGDSSDDSSWTRVWQQVLLSHWQSIFEVQVVIIPVSHTWVILLCPLCYANAHFLTQMAFSVTLHTSVHFLTTLPCGLQRCNKRPQGDKNLQHAINMIKFNQKSDSSSFLKYWGKPLCGVHFFHHQIWLPSCK